MVCLLCERLQRSIQAIQNVCSPSSQSQALFPAFKLGPIDLEGIAKYMTEYEQAKVDLSLEEKMELITELIKYQRNLAEIKKYQAQQSKPSTKTKKRNFYMVVQTSYAGWKSKDFRGMTFEQIEEKFIPVWKQLQDFVPMNFKTKSERVKRPGIQFGYKEKDLRDRRQHKIVPVEEVYIEALQAKYPIIEWEIYSEEQRKYWKIIKSLALEFGQEDFSTTDPIEDKEKELWVELKRLYEPDPRDQLWALQRYMHDPLEWRLYDTCSVHHVSTERGHEIFMLVEKDYPLTKGLTTLLLCNKLHTLNTMTKLAFCDYHNMVAIFEKIESNTNFHQIVDFLEASHIRQRTVTESSIRRHLKLLDDEVFKSKEYWVKAQKIQLSPITHPQLSMNLHPQEDQTTSPEPIPQATTLPSQFHPEISTPRRLTRGAIRISQSKAPTPGADETASPTRDDRHGEAFPTATSLDVGQDRENITKTSSMPHEASPGVTSLGGGEGSMQQKLQ
ncbi:hypothetical protein Tco_1516723 [Tanacetum coccineum]